MNVAEGDTSSKMTGMFVKSRRFAKVTAGRWGWAGHFLISRHGAKAQRCQARQPSTFFFALLAPLRRAPWRHGAPRRVCFTLHVVLLSWVPLDEWKKITLLTRRFLHFVRGCSGRRHVNSFSGFEFEVVRCVRNSIWRDEMNSFCRLIRFACRNFPADCADRQGQNGGSCCPQLSTGVARILGASTVRRRRPQRHQ
jgi:hypothetical protein